MYVTELIPSSTNLFACLFDFRLSSAVHFIHTYWDFSSASLDLSVGNHWSPYLLRLKEQLLSNAVLQTSRYHHWIMKTTKKIPFTNCLSWLEYQEKCHDLTCLLQSQSNGVVMIGTLFALPVSHGLFWWSSAIFTRVLLRIVWRIAPRADSSSHGASSWDFM